MHPMDTRTQTQLDALLARLKQGEDVVALIVATYNARQMERRGGVVMVKGWDVIVT